MYLPLKSRLVPIYHFDCLSSDSSENIDVKKIPDLRKESYTADIEILQNAT